MSSPACAIVGATKPPPVRSPYFEKSCLCRSSSESSGSWRGLLEGILTCPSGSQRAGGDSPSDLSV
eukprot:scaffold70947_cov30-Phaeocystis_antarctica.AAC.1